MAIERSKATMILHVGGECGIPGLCCKLHFQIMGGSDTFYLGRTFNKKGQMNIFDVPSRTFASSLD